MLYTKFLESLKETSRNLIQGSHYPGRESNQAPPPPEYTFRTLPLDQPLRWFTPWFVQVAEPCRVTIALSGLASSVEQTRWPTLIFIFFCTAFGI
jgi:hypothetical protein